jgi:hypothetical protein
MDISVLGISVTRPDNDKPFFSYKTDIVEPICPIINGYILVLDISVPIYPKPIYPFINGLIGSTILVL